MAPFKAFRLDEGVDGIDGTVEHYGIDLSYERADQSEDEGEDYKPFVRLHIRHDFPQKVEDIHFCGFNLMFV